MIFRLSYTNHLFTNPHFPISPPPPPPPLHKKNRSDHLLASRCQGGVQAAFVGPKRMTVGLRACALRRPWTCVLCTVYLQRTTPLNQSTAVPVRRSWGDRTNNPLVSPLDTAQVRRVRNAVRTNPPPKNELPLPRSCRSIRPPGVLHQIHPSTHFSLVDPEQPMNIHTLTLTHHHSLGGANIFPLSRSPVPRSTLHPATHPLPPPKPQLPSLTPR